MIKYIAVYTLILFTLSLEAQSISGFYPSDPSFESCMSLNMARAQQDAVRLSIPENPYFVVTRNRVVDRDTYLSINIDITPKQSSMTNDMFLMWLYSCEHRESKGTNYSSSANFISSLTKIKIPSLFLPNKKACGSVIEYDKGTVLENIPLQGTAIDLVYTSAYNPLLDNNKKLDVNYSFLQTKGFDHRLKIQNTAGVTLDTAYYSGLFDFANYSKVLSFPDAIVENSDFITKYQYAISVDRSLVLSTPTNTDPTHADQYWLPLGYPEEKIFYLYKPEVWGLSGWTFSNHHYFHLPSKTLFTGYGEVIEYDNFRSVNLPPYGQVNLVVERNSGEELYIFDSQGRHLETRDTTWGKPIYKFIYNGNKIIKITNRYNLDTLINYDVDGKLAAIKSPYGLITQVNQKNGKIDSVTDPVNKSHLVTYGSSNEMLTFKSPNAVTTTFTYSQDKALLKEEKTSGLIQSFTKDIVTTATNLHHKLNNFFKTHQTTEVPSSYTSNTIGLGSQTSQYDSENRLISKTDIYPQQSRTVEVNSDESTESQINMNQTLWSGTYTIERVYTRKIPSLGSDFIENTRYTDFWNTISDIDLAPQNRVTTFTQGTRSTQTTFSNAGKTITYTDSEGNLVTSKVNELGQPIEISSKTTQTKFLEYDASYRLSKIQSGTEFEMYSYDQYGNLNKITNSKGQITLFDRNILGQLIKKTLPNGDSIQFEYTDGNELKKITLPNGEVHNFNYDLGDYLASYLSPSGKSTAFFYDSDKRLVQTTKPSGNTIKYNYKSNSENIASIELPNGTRTYNSIDEHGRIRDLTSEDGIRLELSWVSDQIKEQKWYDTDGSLIASLSNGFRKDQIRINSLSLNGQEYAKYSSYIETASAINGKISCSRNTTDYGVNCTNGYGTYLIKSTDGSSTKFLTTFYKNVGQINSNTYEETRVDLTKQLNFYNEVTSINEKTTSRVDYGPFDKDFFEKNVNLTANYDANSRMIGVSAAKEILLNTSAKISADNNVNSYNYPLTSNNNVKEYTSNSKRTVASHNNEDQLIKLIGSVNKDYLYSNDGDLKSITNCNGTTNFEYDVFSNLKKVTLPNGKVIEYKVDGMNRRIKKLVNGQVKEYYLWYDQLHLAAVLDENKLAKVKYLYTIDSRSASLIEKNGVLYKIVHDPGLGSVRYIVNIDTKEIVQEIEYDELGNMTYNSNKDFQVLGYAGGLFDADTGLTRFGARDYDPTIGRWTSKDPIGFNGGDTSLYAYVGGNPLSYNDPSGLKPGDVYTSQEDAGIQAIKDIINKSISEDHEYFGFIFKKGSGFTYSDPQKSPTTSGGVVSCPKDAKASYHTHGGGNNPNHEYFSKEDMNTAINYGMNSYLGTPSKAIKVFYAEGGQLGIKILEPGIKPKK